MEFQRKQCSAISSPRLAVQDVVMVSLLDFSGNNGDFSTSLAVQDVAVVSLLYFNANNSYFQHKACCTGSGGGTLIGFQC